MQKKKRKKEKKVSKKKAIKSSLLCCYFIMEWRDGETLETGGELSFKHLISCWLIPFSFSTIYSLIFANWKKKNKNFFFETEILVTFQMEKSLLFWQKFLFNTLLCFLFSRCCCCFFLLFFFIFLLLSA